METSNIRKRMPVSALLDAKIVMPAIGSAFVKLDPRTLIKNPVMFVLEIVTILTTAILIRDIVVCEGGGVSPMACWQGCARIRRLMFRTPKGMR